MAIFAFLLSLLNSFGINLSHAIAGLAGATVRVIIDRVRPLKAMLTNGFVGVALAVYLTPIILHYFFAIPVDVTIANSIAFGIGMLGMYVFEGVLKLLRKWANNPKLPKAATLKAIIDALSQKPDDKDRSDKSEK